MAVKIKAIAFPKTPGATLDVLSALMGQREALDAQVKALKAQEDALREHLRAQLERLGLASAKGETLGASVVEVTSPDVKDWPALYAYVKRTGAFELLHKRLSSTAWTERLKAGKDVPGVKPRTYNELKITRLRERA